MAHHKRRSRRRDKRVMARCGCCEIIPRPRSVPHPEDASCMGRVKTKRQRPKKERCPVNRTHEWYRENLIKISFEWHWFKRDRKTRENTYRQYEITRHYKKRTCIHCWKEQSTDNWKWRESKPLDNFTNDPDCYWWH